MNERLTRDYHECIDRYKKHDLWVESLLTTVALIAFCLLLFLLYHFEGARWAMLTIMTLGSIYFLVSRVVLSLHIKKLRMRFAERAMME